MADERTTFEQWIIKCVHTQRGAHLAYSSKIGVDWQRIFKMNDAEAVKSEIVKEITEACLVNPATLSVSDFEFSIEGDQLKVTFTVTGKNWLDASRLTVTI